MPGWTLRFRILLSVGVLVLFSLLGSSISLYRITQVSRTLDAVNRVTVPMSKLLAQLQSDSEIYHHELERRLNSSQWAQLKFKPTPMPKWIEEVIPEEIARIDRLISPLESELEIEDWTLWSKTLMGHFSEVRDAMAAVNLQLERHQLEEAARIMPRLTDAIDQWKQQLQWGVANSEKISNRTFERAEIQVNQLRTGLKMVLGVVALLSMLLLWLGERALRPLTDITRVASNIARRGLRKEDRAQIPEIPLGRSDEISDLTREFQRMATTLLEKEKEVEHQKNRWLESNRRLKELGDLNRSIIDSIDSLLIVKSTSGEITQCNPRAAEWLGAQCNLVIGTPFEDWPKLTKLGSTAGRKKNGNQTLGCQIFSLKDDQGGSSGEVWIIDDLTHDLELEDRLMHAEKLATVGQMSATVAHEIRNPLHSIGLEAEIGAEIANRIGNPALKTSLQSILTSVDRLEKITDNYLKLSRLSGGQKTDFDFGDVINNVLAEYALSCEVQGVRVDWSRPAGKALRIHGDQGLLEQAIGNLFKNSLQAGAGSIDLKFGAAESGRIWARIEDDGPGIPEEIRLKLFTPFATTKADGTGLGLSFVRKVIEDHGGEIRSAEPKILRGACFEVYLPQVPPEFRHTLMEKTV